MTLVPSPTATVVVSVSKLTWSELAKLSLMIVSCARNELTSDDVWQALKAAGVSSPEEPRAMGSVMTWGAKEGLIEHTDRVITPDVSTRSNHGRPLAVYTSLTYGDVEPTWPEVEVPEIIL